jgi:hypothetical protein
MALSSTALTTVANVKAALRLTTSYYDAYLENLINAVSEYVAGYTHRTWLGAWETDIIEYPDPRGTCLFLKAIPIKSITSIYEGSDLLSYTDDDTGDYRFERSKPEGIVERSGGMSAFDRDGGGIGWRAGWRQIKVTYKGGYQNQGALPADLVLAVDSIVADVFRSLERAGGIQSESVGSYSVTYGTIERTMQALAGVMDTLNRYKVML